MYSKIPAANKPAALALLDFMTTNASDKYLVVDGVGTLGINIGRDRQQHALGEAKMLKLLPGMSVYLDWFWPPEVTAAFQQGIQAGVAGAKSATQVAQSVQSVFDGVGSQGLQVQN